MPQRREVDLAVKILNHTVRARKQEVPHLVAGLFAGIGGIELGLSKSGHTARLFVENNAHAQSVLRKNFTDVALHDDVTTLRSLPTDVTLLTAGFPCQDLSQAGLVRGIEGRQSSLVEHVFRLLRRKRVPNVLIENVPFMMRLQRGQALTYLTRKLESLGYAWAYRIVDTRSFGLPQRRQRVFIFASTQYDPRTVLFADDTDCEMEPSAKGVTCRAIDASAGGFYWTEGTRGVGFVSEAIPPLKGGSTIGIPSPPAMWIGGGLYLPDIRDAERLQGFPPDWTLVASDDASRRDRWKLVGNAVSVPVAAWFGSRLRNPGTSVALAGERVARKNPWPTAAWNVGSGVFGANATQWPQDRHWNPLTSFLKYPMTPLSSRAAAGFLKRIRASELSIPERLLEDLERSAFGADAKRA
jgi:DNA (cytosine-5)-methyltransferase 1